MGTFSDREWAHPCSVGRSVADDCDMHEYPPHDEAQSPVFSRRTVLSGGVFVGLAALSGCGPRMTASRPSALVNTTPVVPYIPPPLPTPVQSPAATPNAIAVMPRNAWTRTGPAMSRLNPMNGVNRITVHHEGVDVFTATARGTVASRLENIRRAHVSRTSKSGEKWADIGYHYIIDPSGTVWEGRSTRYQGAHVQDENERNLGIMMLGNFEKQAPSAASLLTLDLFVAQQMRRFGVPRSRVFTHRELGPTSCPGRSLQSYMIQTRGRGGRLASSVAPFGLA